MNKFHWWDTFVQGLKGRSAAGVGWCWIFFPLARMLWHCLVTNIMMSWHWDIDQIFHRAPGFLSCIFGDLTLSSAAESDLHPTSLTIIPWAPDFLYQRPSYDRHLKYLLFPTFIPKWHKAPLALLHTYTLSFTASSSRTVRWITNIDSFICTDGRNFLSCWAEPLLICHPICLQVSCISLLLLKTFYVPQVLLTMILSLNDC